MRLEIREFGSIFESKRKARGEGDANRRWWELHKLLLNSDRGFKSHSVHFFLCWKYSIKSGLFLGVVGQTLQATLMSYLLMLKMSIAHHEISKVTFFI
ncbi:MAG TPA: hypothetical protein VFS97_09705 [Nitrososphaeraceae archaeon]|nr:hypothetical protein [Nitrososphaeraceae archaeon]